MFGRRGFASSPKVASITGGTINGTSVGATTPSTGKFTSVETTGAIELGNAADTTINRVSAGVVAVEGKNVYLAGGTDVAIADGGTGASTASAAFTALKQAATDSATGVVELATPAEVVAGTDTSRGVTPAGDAAALANVRTFDRENVIEDLSYLPPVTATWDPGSLADGVGETSAAIPYPGVALGLFSVEAIAPYDLQGITCNAWVDAANSVKARLQNESGGVVDLASGTWAFQARRI